MSNKEFFLRIAAAINAGDADHIDEWFTEDFGCMNRVSRLSVSPATRVLSACCTTYELPYCLKHDLRYWTWLRKAIVSPCAGYFLASKTVSQS